MKQILRIISLMAVLAFLYIAGVLLLGQATYYQPKETELIEVNNNKANSLTDSTYTLFLWNIGFAGLGSESDFFYDGGKMVRSPKELNEKYWKGIQQVIHSAMDENHDFFLLQEVDVNSKRSRGMNQVEQLSEIKQYSSAFAYNYKVKHVPLQLLNPLGRVQSGLLNLSKYEVKEAIRYQLPGSYSWPNKLFFLRRCVLLQRLPLSDTNKELVIVNAHLSAYDDGSLKIQEMEYLKKLILSEFEKGNYVIVGADWNQTPQSEEIQDFLPDWTFAYDADIPTNRSLEAAYNKDSTTKIIDYFLVSPNCTVDSVETKDLEFAYSDHQPVKMKVRFNSFKKPPF